MKYASDFRASARDALKGKWGLAVGVGIVASLLGAGAGSAPSFNFEFDLNENQASGSVEIPRAEELMEKLQQLAPVLIGVLVSAVTIGLIVGIALFVIGSAVNAGYCRFNLELIDGKDGSFTTLFSYFPHIGRAFVMEFLRNLFIFLWSLLFIIPGIIANYSYAMAPYIIAEDTEISPSDAIRKSKEMMAGNRWRLFCLEISFIGWEILAALTLGIGSLWVNPYRAAARADFYREISGTRPVIVMQDGAEFADPANDQTTEF